MHRALAAMFALGALLGCAREPSVPPQQPRPAPVWRHDPTFFRLGSGLDLRALDEGIFLSRHSGRGHRFRDVSLDEFETTRSDPRVQWAVFDLDSRLPDIALVHSPNADEPMYLASIAKIFVAAAVLERLPLDDFADYTRQWNDLITLFTYRSHRDGYGSNAAWLSLLTFLSGGSAQTSANIARGTVAVADHLRDRGYRGIDVSRGAQRASALVLGRYLADVYHGVDRRGNPYRGAEALMKLMAAAPMPRAAHYLPSEVWFGGKGGAYPGGCGKSVTRRGAVGNLVFLEIGARTYSIIVNASLPLAEFPCAEQRLPIARNLIGGLFWEYVAPGAGLIR